jgi:hypothetical protein
VSARVVSHARFLMSRAAIRLLTNRSLVTDLLVVHACTPQVSNPPDHKTASKAAAAAIIDPRWVAGQPVCRLVRRS